MSDATSNLGEMIISFATSSRSDLLKLVDSFSEQSKTLPKQIIDSLIRKPQVKLIANVVACAPKGAESFITSIEASVAPSFNSEAAQILFGAFVATCGGIAVAAAKTATLAAVAPLLYPIGTILIIAGVVIAALAGIAALAKLAGFLKGEILQLGTS